jgi:hypothetical protein
VQSGINLPLLHRLLSWLLSSIGLKMEAAVSSATLVIATILHSITSQKTALFTVTAMIT